MKVSDETSVPSNAKETGGSKVVANSTAGVQTVILDFQGIQIDKVELVEDKEVPPVDQKLVDTLLDAVAVASEQPLVDQAQAQVLSDGISDDELYQDTALP